MIRKTMQLSLLFFAALFPSLSSEDPSWEAEYREAFALARKSQSAAMLENLVVLGEEARIHGLVRTMEDPRDAAEAAASLLAQFEVHLRRGHDAQESRAMVAQSFKIRGNKTASPNGESNLYRIRQKAENRSLSDNRRNALPGTSSVKSNQNVGNDGHAGPGGPGGPGGP